RSLPDPAVERGPSRLPAHRPHASPRPPGPLAGPGGRPTRSDLLPPGLCRLRLPGLSAATAPGVRPVHVRPGPSLAGPMAQPGPLRRPGQMAPPRPATLALATVHLSRTRGTFSGRLAPATDPLGCPRGH